MMRSDTRLRLMGGAVLAMLGSLGVLASRGMDQSQGAPDRNPALVGAIDFHVHELPDSENWRLDAIELARDAVSHGMRGAVLKSHFHSTAEVAYLVRKVVPGFEAFGGIGLSKATGGVNPAAVEDMARVTGGYGKVVWMPTSDVGKVPVSRDGELLPEVRETIGVIGKYNLVLETGHSSPEEALCSSGRAAAQGLKHMVVTHAMSLAPPMSLFADAGGSEGRSVHRDRLRAQPDDSRAETDTEVQHGRCGGRGPQGRRRFNRSVD